MTVGERRAKEVDAKRVEAMAEDKGVEGTLKEGKGPVYRQRMGELGNLKEYYKIGEERVKDAQKRLDAGDTRIAQIERELAGVDGELAKLQRRSRDRRSAHQGGGDLSARSGGPQGRSRARARRLRARPRRVPPAARRGASDLAARLLRPALRRDDRRRGDEGPRAQHRLRSEAGDGSRRRALRAQRRPQGLRPKLRRRRQGPR